MTESSRPDLAGRIAAALADRYRLERELGQGGMYYEKFVDLWKDADPELQPGVKEVRGRLARLAQEPGT